MKIPNPKSREMVLHDAVERVRRVAHVKSGELQIVSSVVLCRCSRIHEPTAELNASLRGNNYHLVNCLRALADRGSFGAGAYQSA